jgi:hypothetical protein
VQAAVIDHIKRQLPNHIGVTLDGLGDVFASPVVSAARTAAIADEWAAATAAVDLPACACCARRPIYDEAGYPVNFVPVADVGCLLGDAGMAAVTLSPEAVREYEALPPRLAVAAPVASVPELGPGLLSTSTHLCCSAGGAQRAAATTAAAAQKGGSGGQQRHLKPAAAELQAHAWRPRRGRARAAPLNSRRRPTSPLSD